MSKRDLIEIKNAFILFGLCVLASLLLTGVMEALTK